jgi:hypothetical protein
MARVVLWPQMLQVKATRIRLRGDLVKRDHGKVEIFSVLDPSSAPAGTDGPSIPDPVVQPPTDAALKTNPIASSYYSFPKNKTLIYQSPTINVFFFFKKKNDEYKAITLDIVRLLKRGTMLLESLGSDWRSESLASSGSKQTVSVRKLREE